MNRDKTELEQETEQVPREQDKEDFEENAAEDNGEYKAPGWSDKDDGDTGGVIIEDPPATEEEQKAEDRRIRAESLKMAGSFGNFGLFLVIAVVFGYVIGQWLDGKLETSPWMTVFWVVCAVIASVMEFVKNVKKAQKFDDK